MKTITEAAAQILTTKNNLDEAISFESGLKAIEIAEKSLKSAGETLGNKGLVKSINDFSVTWGKDASNLAKEAMALSEKVGAFRNMYAADHDQVYN